MLSIAMFTYHLEAGSWKPEAGAKLEQTGAS